MKASIKILSISLLIVLLFTACTKKIDTNTQINSTIEVTEEPTQEPEPTPSFTFEEIVAVQPDYFVDGGDEFQVKSSEPNYYGEITVGQRSYVDGASNDLQGTYALFVTDFYGGSASIDIELTDSGYSYKNQFYGTQDGDTVKYPFDTNDIYSSLSDCHYNRNQSLVINNLTYLYIDWRRTQAVFSEKAFNMLAVVISKDEAVHFVQDGTLPHALQGLTVIGLDDVFKKPSYAPGAHDKVETPETDFEYQVLENQVYITSYIGKSSEVVIPSKINSFPVVVIGSNAFMENTSLKSVTIPESITTIGVQAFINCSSLEEVTFSNGIGKNSIVFGDDVFKGCTSLSDKAKENINSVIKQ